MDRSVHGDAETPSFWYRCIRHAKTFSCVHLFTTDCELRRWIPLLPHRVEPGVATIIRLLRYIAPHPWCQALHNYFLIGISYLTKPAAERKGLSQVTVLGDIVCQGRKCVGTGGSVGAGVRSSDLCSSHFLVEEET